MGAAIGGGLLCLALTGLAGFFMMRKKKGAEGYVQEQSVDVNAMLDAEMALTKEQYNAVDESGSPSSQAP